MAPNMGWRDIESLNIHQPCSTMRGNEKRVACVVAPSGAALCAKRKPPSLIDIYRMLGQLGKEKMQRRRLLSYAQQAPGLVAFLATALLAACATGLPSKFVGTLLPVAGSCDEGNRAVVTRAGSSIMFLPQDGVLVLDGRLSDNGEVSASVAVRGINHVPYRLVFTGKVRENQIVGTYVTPRCRYNVTLAGQ
jgi:hypothetical protein